MLSTGQEEYGSSPCPLALTFAAGFASKLTPFCRVTERLRPISYAKSHVILIAFALDSPDSLDNVSFKWNEEVRQLCGPNIPVILVGLKKDLRDRNDGAPYVTTEQVRTTSSRATDPKADAAVQGQRVATDIGARVYKECSALLNEGVDEIFEAATRQAMVVRATDGRGGGSKAKRSEKDEGSGGCCVIV